MRYIALTLILLFAHHFANAQYNNLAHFGGHFSTQSSMYQPSHLGKNIDEFEIKLLGAYGWFGNTSFNYDLVEKALSSDPVEPETVDDIIDKLEGDNLLGAGAYVQAPLSAAVKIPKDDEEFFTFSIGARATANANFEFSNNVMEVLWEGNKQFRGQRINLGPVEGNVALNQEYYLGYTMPIELESVDDVSIRPGIRLSVIQSDLSVYTEKGNIFMETEQDGKYIEFENDYNYHTALAGLNDIELFSGVGSGFGVDLGITTHYKEHMEASLSVIDIGSITYSGNVESYSNSATFRYEGVEVDPINVVEDQSVDVNIDSIETFLDPTISDDDYSMPLGTKLVLQGTYRLQEDDYNEETFFKHNIHFLYVQGFNNHLDASSRPFFSLGYDYNLNKIFHAGASLGYGAYNNFMFGPYVSVKGGPVRFGIGTNNILPLFGGGTGADLSVNLSLAF